MYMYISLNILVYIVDFKFNCYDYDFHPDLYDYFPLLLGAIVLIGMKYEL